MICGEVQNLIGGYIEDDLSHEIRTEIEVHLLGCRDCAWEAQSLHITRLRLRNGIGDVIASDAFRARAMSRLRAEYPQTSTAESPAEPSLQFVLPMTLPEPQTKSTTI